MTVGMSGHLLQEIHRAAANAAVIVAGRAIRNGPAVARGTATASIASTRRRHFLRFTAYLGGLSISRAKKAPIMARVQATAPRRTRVTSRSNDLSRNLTTLEVPSYSSYVSMRASRYLRRSLGFSTFRNARWCAPSAVSATSGGGMSLSREGGSGARIGMSSVLHDPRREIIGRGNNGERKEFFPSVANISVEITVSCASFADVGEAFHNHTLSQEKAA